MKKIILIIALIICQSCGSSLYHSQKELEVIKVELFDFGNKPLGRDNSAYGHIISKEMIHRSPSIPIKPRTAKSTDDILIFNKPNSFYKEDNKKIGFAPYIKYKDNRYLNVTGMCGFNNYNSYIKITNPGRKYSLIILSEEKFEIKSAKGQFVNDFGIANSIIDAGGKYYDKNKQRFKIFVIYETELETEFYFHCDGAHLTRNRLKRILKENNIEADMKKIKVEQIVEVFDKINNG